MLIRSTLLVLIGLTVAFEIQAAEDPPAARDEARRQFDLGVRRTREGAYADALAAFRKAYEASPNYSVLYNIAEVQRQLGDPASAVRTFERYLREGGARIAEQRRAKVKALLVVEERRTALVTFQLEPPSAQLRLDGTGVDATAEMAGQVSMRVNAGTHEAQAAMSDRTSPARTFTVAAGEAVTIPLVVPASVAPPATPPPSRAATAPPIAEIAPTGPAAARSPAAPSIPLTPPPDPAHSTASVGSHRRVAGYALGAAGVAGIGLGLGAYLSARSSFHEAIDRGCAAGEGGCTGDARRYYEDARTRLTISNVAWISGTVLLIGGAVLVLTAPADHPRPIALGPTFGGGGGGVELSCVF